jgi:hypothetical protein
VRHIIVQCVAGTSRYPGGRVEVEGFVFDPKEISPWSPKRTLPKCSFVFVARSVAGLFAVQSVTTPGPDEKAEPLETWAVEVYLSGGSTVALHFRDEELLRRFMRLTEGGEEEALLPKAMSAGGVGGVFSD